MISPGGRTARAVAALVAAAGGYLLFEAQWVRLVHRDVPVPDLSPEWDGLRIAHLSDTHTAFVMSLNLRAARRAFRLAMAQRPDLIALSGDLAGGPRRLTALCVALRMLRAPLGVYAVPGNHDRGHSKVPFARAVDLDALSDCGVRFLVNEVVEVERGQARLQVLGLDDWKHGCADSAKVLAAANRDPAPLRLLLSHYGQAAFDLPPEAVQLTLSGDTHGGQICVPWPGGPIMLSQPRAQFKDGLYWRGGHAIHVTRGVGTSLLPFRLWCRPEVVILRLVAA